MNYNRCYIWITCLFITTQSYTSSLFSDNTTLDIIKTHCSYITPEAIERDAALSEVSVIFPRIFNNSPKDLPITINLLQKYALLTSLFFKTNTNESYLSALPSFLFSATSLIQPHGNGSSLFNAINMTTTSAGSVQLLKMLLTTKPTAYLTEQQKVISFLAKTDTLRQSLFSSLETIRKHENAFFYFLTADNNLTTLINTLFYSGEKSWSKYLGLDYFDTSPTAQNAYYGLNKLRSLLALGQTGSKIKNWIDFGQDLKQGGRAALQAIINSKPLEYALNMEGLQMLHDRTIKHTNPFEKNGYIRENLIQNPQYRNITAELYGNHTHPLYSSTPNINKTKSAVTDMHEKLSNLSPTDQALAYAGLTTSILGTHQGGGIVENIGNATVYAWNDLLKGIKSAENYEQMTSQLLMYMHGKLIGMGSLVRQLQNIASVLKQSPNFAKHIVGAEYITGAFDDTSSILSSNFHYLIGQLLTNTFTGSAQSWISNKGRIIATYKLMYECLAEWIPVLQAVGNIDAFVSCAQLYNLYQDKPETLSLVMYSNQDKAHATMTQLWDITRTPAHITQPSATISDTNSTVENTAVPAATNALLLGATIGLAPAKHMEMTADKLLKLLENVVKK